ncbi:MAG: hypothetical protein HQL31_08385, partial [Planctomycetes bacterium]|nr:hypothetical protein [Planctomycetota bacterium]
MDAAISSTFDKLHFVAIQGKATTPLNDEGIGQFIINSTGSITTNGGDITVQCVNNSIDTYFEHPIGTPYGSSGDICLAIQLDGAVNAGGGNIAMIASKIKNSGSLITHAGNVLLDAGATLLQQGEIIAPGGSIFITASDAYFDFGKTSVTSNENKGGEIKINTTYSLGAVKGHLFDASGVSGGKVLMDAGQSGNLLLSATTRANGDIGNGGLVQMTGKQVTLLNADISAAGIQDGGKIHIGGQWQGNGPLRHAKYLTIGSGTRLSAIGDKGAGGEVVAWSVEQTDFLGKAVAFGATAGRIEISSIGVLGFNGELNAGDGGQVLFDPKNILVSDIYMAWVAAISSPEPADNQYFGDEVAVNGDLLAIGARGYDGGVSGKGAVYLFNGMSGLSGPGFQPTYVKRLSSDVALANATAVPTLDNSARFGSGIGIAANGVIAVGATGYTTSQGRVFLFKNAGADFANLEYVTFLASEAGAAGMTALIDNDYFGESIAFDGNGNMAVGAARRTAGGNASAGGVFMFSGVGTDFSGLTYRWELNNQSKPADLTLSTSDSYLGVSLAFSGSNLIVGSTGYNNYGSVYFFSGIATANTNNSADYLTWHARQGDPGTGTQSWFGYSVAVQGDLLFVGATGGGFLANPAAGIAQTGKFRQVNVFTGVNALFAGAPAQSNPFTSQHILTLSELKGGALEMPNLTNTGFANSLAVSDNFLLIGTPNSPSGGTNRGQVQVLNFDPARVTDAVAGATFANLPGDNSWISTSAIETLLNANTSVTLQANNDIIIAGDIRKTTSGTATLTLEAGRSVISSYAGITSNSNDIIIVAGSGDAQPAHTEAGTRDIHLTLKGTSTLTVTSNTTLPGNLILTAPNNVVIDGSATTGVNANGTGRTTIDAGGMVHIYTGGNYRNLEIIGSSTKPTALLSAWALSVFNLAADLANLYLVNGTSLAIGTIGGTSGITASGTIYLSSSSTASAFTFSQTQKIAAGTLILRDGSGENDIFNLTDSQNDIDVLASAAGTNKPGSLNFVNSTGFTIGSGSYLNNGGSYTNVDGVSAAGPIDVSTVTGDLTLNKDVSTTNATPDAVKLNAGKGEAPGTAAGGNIIVDGGAVNFGAGGTTLLYTGDIAGSTGVTGLAGYADSYYNSDETSGLSPGAVDGLYVVYRADLPAYDVTVGTDPSANGAWSGGNPDVWTPSASGATLSVSDINNRLDTGTSVVINTGSGASAESGDIIVSSAINKTAGAAATLTLKAAVSIVLNSDITSSIGSLDTIFWADSDVSGGGVIDILSGCAINTNGGDLTLAGGADNGDLGGMA